MWGGGLSEGAAEVDWEGLRAAAREMIAYAYVPYSRYPVGAAALVDDGRVVTGCNVENAVVRGDAVRRVRAGLVLGRERRRPAGGLRLRRRAGAALMPCGRCRQLLWEHGGPELLVDTPEGILPMTAVLPQAFGPDDLEHVQRRTTMTVDLDDPARLAQGVAA